jgi:hypothetical protein
MKVKKMSATKMRILHEIVSLVDRDHWMKDEGTMT